MTQAEQSTFTPTPMTSREENLLTTLRTHLHLNQEQTFTVDTLRMLGFDRFIQPDKLGRRNYGSIIGKWRHYGHIERTGKSVPSQLESNHGHREQVWKMKERGEEQKQP